MRTAVLGGRGKCTVAVGLALLGSACANEPELRRVLTRLEQDLAEKQEIAQNLNERRREMDMLEMKLAEMLANDGGTSAPLEPATATPPARPAAAAALAPLVVPPESALEGPGAKRLRARIVDTQRLIAELERILGEVNNINLRKREVEEKLRVLTRLRRGP